MSLRGGGSSFWLWGARRVAFREVLLIVAVLTVVMPVARIIPLSLLEWSDSAQDFVGPLSLQAYASFFVAHRGGVVLENLLLAGISVVIVGALGIPALVGLKIAQEKVLIGVLELGLIVPFLFSPALRLFSLRSLLQEGGAVPQLFALMGVDSEIAGDLIYSNIGICLGLGFSYAALFALPVAQAVKSIPESVIEASRDAGMNRWSVAYKIILPLTSRGILTGAVLMLTVAWFSSLEPAILGTSPSVLSMLQNLLAAKKYAESLAFALVPFGISCVGLFILAWLCRPEELFSTEGRDDR